MKKNDKLEYDVKIAIKELNSKFDEMIEYFEQHRERMRRIYEKTG